MRLLGVEEVGIETGRQQADRPAPGGKLARPPVGKRRAWGWLLAGVLAAQALLAAVVPVLPEEAYHWNFARHLDWSYYDHPPMIAWAIALGRLLLGDTALGIRLVPLLFALGTTGLLARLSRRWYGDAGAWWAILLYAVQPAALLVGGWGFPDAPLLFFWTLALTWVWRALDTRRPRWWLAAGAALGGGLLSKYTAAFLVPSVLLYLLSSRRDRRWLATPWPYLAGVCSLVVFAPVLYWNAAHDWMSFRFQSVARFEAANGFSLRSGLQALTEQWLLIVPLTLPLAVLALGRGAGVARPAERFGFWSFTRPAEQLLFWSFAPMALFFSLLGWTPSFHLLWLLPAYLGLTVAMAGVMAGPPGRLVGFYRARQGWLVGIAATAAVLVGLHTAWVFPGLLPLRETYGWDEVAERSRALHAALPEGTFYLAVGGRPYAPASQLAFHLGTPGEVQGPNLLGWEGLQYRFWADPERLVGKDAVVVVEGGDPSGRFRDVLRGFFQTVEPAGEFLVPIGRFPFWPRPSERFALYRAYDYRPPP